MPTHAETKTLPYTAEQMFDLVADVDNYPKFLPWCIASRITKTDGNVIEADLIIGYKLFREKFSSRVTLERPDHIRVDYLDGPLKHLSNEWKFTPEGEGSCVIDFYVDFDLQTPVLKQIVEIFFNEAVKRMVSAFEARAEQIYR